MKRLIIIILFLCTAFLYAQSKSEEAYKAIQEKNYDAALNLAHELLNSDSTDSALKILLILKSKEPDNLKVTEQLGDAYNKIGVLELAASNYLSAEEKDSTNISLKFKLADVYYKQKEYTDAVNTYLRIIRLDSTNVEALKNVAKIFYLAKLYQNAAYYLDKYLKVENSEDGFVKAVNSFLEIGKYQDAYNYAKKGLQLYPQNNVLKKDAAVAAYHLSKFDEVVNLYLTIPDSLLTVSDLVNSGRASEISDRDSLALVFFEKAYERDSTLKDIFIDLANLNYLKKNYNNAIKFYGKLIEANPQSESAYRYLGFAYFQEQKYEDCRKALLTALSLNNNQVSTHFWLAQTYKALDSLSKADDEFRSVIKLIEGNENKYKNEGAEAYGFLGQRAFENKNYPVAAGYLKKALLLKPNILPFLIMLASSYHQMGNYDEAIKFYRRVLALDPKNEVAKKGLRMLSAD